MAFKRRFHGQERLIHQFSQKRLTPHLALRRTTVSGEVLTVFIIQILILLVFCMLAPMKALAQERENNSPSAGGYEFTVKSSIVNISFSVKGKDGKSPANLTKDDFRVLEDGQKQEIKYFSREPEGPLSIAIIFDKSKSVLSKFKFMQEATTDFLRTILRKGKDKAMIIAFDEHVEVLQDFTDDAALLGRFLEGLQAVGGTSLFDSIQIAGERLASARGQGRKVIILVTDGEDTTSTKTMKEALASALTADATIYAIGVKSKLSFNNRAMRGVPVLERLTEQTGGRVFFPAKDEDKLIMVFKNLEEELRNQYSIGYASSNKIRDGGFRKIEIITANGRQFNVHARKGYYASLMP